jgi:hypothetical protein
LEDFRSRDNWWKQSTIATQFVQQFPLEEMKSMDELTNAKEAWCLAKPGEVYVVYFPIGTKNAKIKLPGGKTFSIKWFNPRNGGELQNGSITEIKGTGFQILGNPPTAPGDDWVVVVVPI